MADHPIGTGTVTFLFTDIEGSTKLAQAQPAAWPALQARHHALLRAALEAHHGYVFQVVGDAFCIAFATALDALLGAVEAQRAVGAEAWGETPIRVRMGIHTGAATLRPDGEYHGYLTLAHAQRVMSTAYGAQALVSNATAGLLAGLLPDGITLRDMGEHRLKGILTPERLWQLVVPDLPQDFPALQTLNAIRNNLPIQVTSFVGRAKEIAEVKRLLTTTRLLTLTGSGGTGKTRLSLQVAAEVLDNYKDGVWLVELAPLADPALVAQTVASALGVQQEQGQPLMATLLDWLRPKQLLLILDNCEHLIAACAAFADGALHAVREMRILATSREALAIAGETSYHVPSLGSPTPHQANSISPAQLTQFPAVQLFNARASQSLAAFQLTDANAPAVAQICARLDGIPLAIELAAARVKVLSPEKIAERLDDRFRLLTGGSRTALPRQQTLRGAIDWSYSLLSEPERVLLRRLSVFAGGWTLEATEEICIGDGIATDEVLDLLTQLVAKSLVLADGQAAEPRYHMLETVRQYAREKLLDAHESEALRDRHLKHFFDMAERAEPILLTGLRTEWLPRLEAELDNLRIALEWACERDIEAARQLAGNLRMFWSYTDRMAEGVAWYERLLGSSRHSEETKGYALVQLGASIGTRTPIPDARSHAWLTHSAAIFRTLGEREKLAETVFWLASATAALGDPAGGCALFEANEDLIRRFGRSEIRARALSQFGRAVATVRNDTQKAVALLEESLSIGFAENDPIALGMSYMIYGLWSLQLEDYDAAWRYQLEAIRWLRLSLSRSPLSLALGNAGDVATLRHDYQSAHALYAEVLGYSKAFGFQLFTCLLLARLGYLAVQEGVVEQAEALLGECMRMCRERNALESTAECLVGYAELRRVQGHTAQAVRLLATPALLPFRAHPGNSFNHIAYLRSVDAARAQLSATDFASACAEGSAMTLEQAIALAMQPVAPISEPTEVHTSVNPADASGLTARERDVLRLLAVGLSNDQIAERLVVSTFTVRAHLRAIYSKLGVTTRSAATRYALEHHLV